MSHPWWKTAANLPGHLSAAPWAGHQAYYMKPKRYKRTFYIFLMKLMKSVSPGERPPLVSSLLFGKREIAGSYYQSLLWLPLLKREITDSRRLHTYAVQHAVRSMQWAARSKFFTASSTFDVCKTHCRGASSSSQAVRSSDRFWSDFYCVLLATAWGKSK